MTLLDTNTILRKVLQSRQQQQSSMPSPSRSSTMLPEKKDSAPRIEQPPPIPSTIAAESPLTNISTTAESSPPQPPAKALNEAVSVHDRLTVTKSDIRRNRSRSHGRSRERLARAERSRSRSRSYSPPSKRHRSRDTSRRSRERSRDGRRRRYSRSRSRPRRRSPPPRSRRSRSRDRFDYVGRRPRSRDERRRSRSRESYFSRSSRPSRPDYERRRREPLPNTETIDTKRPRRPRSPARDKPRSLAEELVRLDHTVRVKDIAPNVRDFELKRFFEDELIGEVASAKIVKDHKTGVSKGVAYVEFKEIESVPKALRLTGKVLKGSAILVDRTDTERSLLIHTMGGVGIGTTTQPKETVSRKLFVGNIDSKINDDQLTEIFSQFGTIETLDLQKDHLGQSKGIAFISYSKPQDAKRALETMNGFRLVGRALALNFIQEKVVNDHIAVETDGQVHKVSRAELMAKLSRSEPQPQIQSNEEDEAEVPVVSNCVLLKNMFNPSEETSHDWDKEIAEDVLDECSKFGKVLDIFVDKKSDEGRVYLQFESVDGAQNCIKVLHGRWFAKKQLQASCISVFEYKKHTSNS